METSLALFSLGILTSFYGAGAGGAGLVVVPILILMGLSAQEAVATAIFGYLSLCTVGAATFYRAGESNAKTGLIGALFMVIGSVIGLLVAHQLPTELYRQLVGWFILVMVSISMFVPSLGKQMKSVSPAHKRIGYPLFIIIGVFATTMGAGASILCSFVLMICFGETYLRSAGTRKFILLANNTLVSVVYTILGVVQFSLGIPLLLGCIVGTYLGSKFVLLKGNEWVRWMFIVVSLISALKILLS